MSSSARTPQSVLDAPTLTPVMVSLDLGIIDGQNRHGRRHVKYRREGKTFLIPKAARVAATNVPLTRDQSGRLSGKRAARRARHALRFT